MFSWMLRRLMRPFGVSTATPPVAVAGPGWVASDNGLVPSWDGPRQLRMGERRRFYLDFGPMAELQAGDTLTGTPTVSASLTAAAPAIVGTRVEVTLTDVPAPGEYPVSCQVDTTGGSRFVRSGWIHAPNFPAPPSASIGVGPVPTYPAVGWVVSDDGLVYAVGGPHRKAPAEVRRYWMDFVGLAEIKAGDSIKVSVTPTIGSTPSGLSFANVAVSGTRVYVDISSGTLNVDYQVTFTITLNGGAVISRSGVLRVVAL